MDQLICASLSHTPYWYEVGMSKVPRCMTVGLVIVVPDFLLEPQTTALELSELATSTAYETVRFRPILTL